VVLAVALIVFGPDKLPEVARSLGRLAAQFRRAVDEIRHEVDVAGMEREFKSSVSTFRSEITNIELGQSPVQSPVERGALDAPASVNPGTGTERLNPAPESCCGQLGEKNDPEKGPQ
jgi:TatA/E family protein of Tat protein translocase